MAARAVPETRSRGSLHERFLLGGNPTRLSCFIVALASFLCLVVCNGNAITAPLYLQSISTSLGVNQNIAAFPGALVSGFALISGPFASMFLAFFGFRSITIAGGIIGAVGYSTSYFSTNFIELCILHGVVAGVGLGLIVQASMVVINFYFTKWRRLATCLCLCGTSFGSVIFPLVFKVYIDESRAGLKSKERNENWRIYLVVQGGTVLLCCIFGLAYRPVKLWIIYRRSSQSLHGLHDPNVQSTLTDQALRAAAENARMRNQMDTGQETNSQTGNETNKKQGKCCGLNINCQTLKYQLKEHMDFRLFKSPTFIILTLSGCIKALAVNVPSTYITERYKMLGANDWADDYALAVLGLSAMAGRIACGFISDLEMVNTTVEQNVALIVAGVASIASGMNEDTLALLLTFEVVYGFCQGVFHSMRMLMLVDLLGIERINSSLGLSSLFQGIPLIFGPTLMGSMNHSEAMDQMFIVAGCVMIFAALICFPLNSVNRWERNKDLKEAASRNE